MASFIGNDFSFEALSAVTDIGENELLEVMENMLKTGLVKERAIRGKDVYSFVDIMVRDVVHEEISHLRRKKLHNVVGCALEKTYAQKTDEHLGELAYHFLEGGNHNKALEYLLKAGEKAIQVHANTEAVSHLKSALTLLEDKEGELGTKGRVLEMLGDAENLIGEYENCMKHWDDAFQLWSRLDEEEGASRLNRKMANVLWDKKGDTEKAKEHHDKALKILETQPESVELASLYEDIAHMYYRTGDMAIAFSWAQKAIELAKKLNAYDIVASSHVTLGTVLVYKGDPKKAIECLERGLKIALKQGYVETALRAYNNIALGLSTEENEKCLECYEKGLELAKKVGDIYNQSLLGFNLAGMHFNMGNIDQAVIMANETVALDRKTGNKFHLYTSANALGFAYQILGELDKSEQYFKEAQNISKQLDDFQSITGGYDYLGLSHFDKGDYVKAKEFFEKLNQTLEKAGDKFSEANASQYLIWTYIELGETEKAKNLIDRMYEFALQVKNNDLVAALDALKAMLLRNERKWEESIEQFERSLHEFEVLKAKRWNPYFFARMALFEHAQAYLERNQGGDREKAHNLLNQALEIFQKMGAKRDIEQVEARLIYIETGQVVSEPKPISHAATGYADLDKLLYGGIPPNYAVALTSPSCDERDLLIRSFLETGAKKGEVTFYVTINPGLARLLAENYQPNFYLFICNPQADAIVKDLPNAFKLKGVENLTDISIALTTAIRKLDPSLKGPRRACISLISDILLQHHAVQTRRWLAGLIPELQSEAFTTLAIMDPEMHPPQEVRAVLDLFDGEINIHEKETDKGLEKFLKIKKMSNQKYSDNELLLRREDLQK
jgi:tetratricopeptide (TPR) repeat protein